MRYYYPKLLYAKSSESVNRFVRLVTTRFFTIWGCLPFGVLGCRSSDGVCFCDWLAGYDSFKYFFLMYSPVVFFWLLAALRAVIYQNSSHYARDNLFYIAMSLVVALGVLIFGKISIYGVVLGFSWGTYFIFSPANFLKS